MSFQKGDIIEVTEDNPGPGSCFTYWKIGQRAKVIDVTNDRDKHDYYTCRIFGNNNPDIPGSQVLRSGQIKLVARLTKADTTISHQSSGTITCAAQNVGLSVAAKTASLVSSTVSSSKEQKPMSLKIIQVLEHNATDISKLSVNQIAEAIKKQQSEIDALVAITPKTKSMGKRIDVLQAELAAFVQAIDAL